MRGPRGGKARVTITRSGDNQVVHDRTVDYYAPDPTGSNSNSWDRLTYNQSEKFSGLNSSETYTLRIDPQPVSSQRKEAYIDGFRFCNTAQAATAFAPAEYGQGETQLALGTTGLLLGTETAHPFEVTGDTVVISAILDFAPTADLDLKLLDPSGRVIATSADQGSLSETLDAAPATAGTYRLVVVNRNNAATPYVLTFTPTLRR